MTDTEAINLYMSRFINQTTLWGKHCIKQNGDLAVYYQKPGQDTFDGKYSYQPVTLALVLDHLKGKITCSWTAIDEKGRSKWLGFDSDTDNGDLDKLEAKLRSWGIHVIREGKRLGRAGHLWILFDKPIKAELLIVLAEAMLRLCGLHRKSENHPDGIEIFPTHPKGLSQLRGPLGINRKPEANKACGWFDACPEHRVKAQLQWLAGQPLNNADAAIEKAKKWKSIIKTKRKRKRKAKSDYEQTIFSLLEQAEQEIKEAKNGFITECPVCIDEGHDQHQDNLHIRADGVFSCWYGGMPGQIHTASKIIAALKLRIGDESIITEFDNPSIGIANTKASKPLVCNDCQVIAELIPLQLQVSKKELAESDYRSQEDKLLGSNLYNAHVSDPQFISYAIHSLINDDMRRGWTAWLKEHAAKCPDKGKVLSDLEAQFRRDSKKKSVDMKSGTL